MPRRTLRFPDRFLWGAATAAHQNEGNTLAMTFGSGNKTRPTSPITPPAAWPAIGGGGRGGF